MMPDPPPPPGQVLTILTTEHFVLQTARGGTIGESNGRAAIYLGTVSSGLIALGFAAGDSHRFALFAGAVLPALLIVGWFTFVRLVQTGVESLRYLTRIQRIRRWYATQVPDSWQWFPDVAGDTDDLDEPAAAVRSMGMRPSIFQMLYTAASMVAALNSLILGATACLAIRGSDLLPTPWAVTVAAVLAAASFTGHVAFERHEFDHGVTQDRSRGVSSKAEG
jgi:MFS family permease